MGPGKPVCGGTLMTGRDYTYTFATGAPTAPRAFRTARAAVVALAAVSAFGVALVMSEQVSVRSARAVSASTASTASLDWALEARWWGGGDTREANWRIAPRPDNDLTFAKGYELRLAARQAAAATQVAAVAPPAEAQPDKAATVAHAEAVPLPKPRRVAVARIDPPVERPTRFDPRAATLAFGEQRPSPQAFFAAPRNPFSGLFGSTY